jgi:hypothetical protein
MARDAFGGLISSSFWHRWTQRGFLGLALLVTLLAVRESSNVALGRAYMQTLADLRAQQANLALERAQVERLATPIEEPDELIDKTNAHRLTLSAFSLCDRKYALAAYFAKDQVYIPSRPPNPIGQGDQVQKIAKYNPVEAAQDKNQLEVNGSESEREICGRDYALQTNIQIAHDALRRYAASWTEILGPAAMTVQIARGFSKADAGQQHDDELSLNDGRKQDIEYILGPVLLVWGKYILPVIFGLLGTLVFVILDFLYEGS